MYVKILPEQEKEEIEKKLIELKAKLSAINFELFPVKVDVKVSKDGHKLILVKGVCLSTELNEELRKTLKELKLTMSDIKADAKKIHIDVDIESALAQEKTLTEEEKEKIRKKVKDVQLKLAEKLELKYMKLKLGKKLDVDSIPEICIALKYDAKFDEHKKVSIQVKPKLALKVKPEFPEEAEKKGIYGEVVVEGTTDEKGNVVKVEVIKGAHELLNEAVVNAVKQWKYELPEHKGKTYAITFTVTVHFNIDDKDKDKDKKYWTVKIDKLESAPYIIH